MKRRTLLFFLLAITSSLLAASAQKLLKRPLTYMPADSVFVLPRGDHNVIMDIMAVAPFAGPQPIVATKEDRKLAKKHAMPEDSPLREQIYSNAKMLLLTGHASYAELLDEAYFTTFPHTLADETVYSLDQRQGAAQHLLNLTGCIVATDNNREVYINLFENCVTRVHTSKFRMLLDIISDYPNGSMVKLRINGLDKPNARFALHIRVPEHGAAQKYYINGHEIIRPVFSEGYLVIDREWRDGEEVYFILNQR